MTRKDFVLIAQALSHARADYLTCSIMADYLSGTNPSFRRQTFIKACGHADTGAE